LFYKYRRLQSHDNAKYEDLIIAKPRILGQTNTYSTVEMRTKERRRQEGQKSKEEEVPD